MNHFDLAYLAATPAFLANAYYRRWRQGKYRRSLPGMFGGNLPSRPLPDDVPRVWMHSVSVGESVAAGAVFRVLRERHPDWEVVSTTTTETGQDQARRSLADATHHDFAPVDFSWTVGRFLDRYRPSMYFFFETEIWPNMLLECGRRGIPVFLVNGKLSDGSAAAYRRIRWLLRAPLDQVSGFLMQTRADARRLRGFHRGSAPVEVIGNVKFDALPAVLSEEERRDWRRRLGLAETDFVVVAGSTHPGEEKIVYTAMRKVRGVVPGARVVIAPRHPERFDLAAEELRKAGASVHRASTGEPAPEGSDVLLFDRMGELGRLYGTGDVALVGGAWAPIGGHNLLEPAIHGVPVIHGPHMHEQKEIMRLVRRDRATLEVEEGLLDEAILRFAVSEDARRELGGRGRRVAEANKGAAHRAMDRIDAWLGARVRTRRRGRRSR